MALTKCINKCTLTLSLNVFGIIVDVCTQMYGNEHVNNCLYLFKKSFNKNLSKDCQRLWTL